MKAGVEFDFSILRVFVLGALFWEAEMRPLPFRWKGCSGSPGVCQKLDQKVQKSNNFNFFALIII